MLICIGILAHNEAARIGQLISDLRRQTLFTRSDISVEIHIVANGCDDDTASVSAEALKASGLRPPRIHVAVHELEKPGKANAWNAFIHELTPKVTDVAILLDADIRLPDPAALERLYDRMVASDEAAIVVGTPVSDLALRTPKTMTEWLVRLGTGTGTDIRTAVSGGMYCARFRELAQIVMPTGLPVENGYLRAMLLTKSFTQEEDLRRIAHVSEAPHVFESNRTLSSLFRHHVRLAIGSAINTLLFRDLRDLTREGADLASLIRGRNADDPDWLNGMVREHRENTKYFLVHHALLLQRAARLRSLPAREKVASLPMFCIGTLFDVLLYFRANQLMRRGKVAGFW